MNAVTDPSTRKGSDALTDSYDNLLDAIERAFELGAQYSGTVSITIYLMDDNTANPYHYLVNKRTNFYIPTYVDRDSTNIAMTIKPYTN
jgi:hypothetical protein